MRIDDSMNGQSIDVAVGEVIEIRLDENRTAGYQWRLVDDGARVCTRVGDSYQAGTGPLGQSGSHRWELRATRPGEATIALAYRRPWEQDEAAARTFSLHLRVSPPSPR